MLTVIPIILCGGQGTRLWPLSRQSYPKQFLSLQGKNKDSLLQQTYKRISELEGLDDPIIICNEEHRFLVAEQMRCIGVKPKAIILENVRGLTSHDKGNTWNIIQEELKKAQYDIHFEVIDAVHWVPQHRKRIFIVGFDKKQFDTKKSDFFNFPVEQTGENKIKSILQKRVEEKYTLKDGTWNSLQTIKERNKSLPKDKKKGFGYSIVDRNGPSRTLTKRYFKDGAEILIEQKDKNPRRLTPLEGLRLMGFGEIEKKFNDPKKIFTVSDSQAFRQLGNAVVPQVVEAVGREVLRTLENN